MKPAPPRRRTVRKWAAAKWRTSQFPLIHASPILVDALAAAGIGIDRLIDTVRLGEAGLTGVFAVHPLRREGGVIQLMDAHGALKRCDVQRRADCLDVSLHLDEGVLVASDRDTGILTIEASLPETIVDAAAGRHLTELVDHPILRREEYRIRHVQHFGRLTMTQIMFDAPMVRIGEGVDIAALLGHRPLPC